MKDDNLPQRMALIEILVLDVDGVLTDGRISYGDGEQEYKSFHVRDGSALRWWQDLGKQVALITGRDSPIVARRARELGIASVFQGQVKKLPALKQLLARTGFSAQQVCAMGDDLPDIPVLREAGVAIAVADACPEVCAQADWTTTARGGHAAVREAIERLLQAQGLWARLIEQVTT